MNRIEWLPFSGEYKGLGTRSNDSVPGILQDEEGNLTIVKWSKRHISTAEEAREICAFTKRSVALCQAALGEEFVLPTQVVFGAKKDGGVPKFKVYTVQPYIEGWTAKTVPLDVYNDRVVTDQWNRLNSRLFTLYNAGYYINQQVGKVDPTAVFPITLTLGSSRREALIGNAGTPMPKTPNLLIERNSLQLGICDFGEYVPWKPAMEKTYRAIFERVKQ